LETRNYSLADNLDSTLLHLGAVISNHLLDTLLDVPLGLPLEGLLGSGGVGPSSLGVVGGDLLVDDVDSLGEGVALLLLDLLDNVLKVRWDKIRQLKDSP
jgi:hypothetical protein